MWYLRRLWFSDKKRTKKPRFVPGFLLSAEPAYLPMQNVNNLLSSIC
ncbi:hypothetical protein WP2S18C03_44300 [Aeromonas veronii]|nr:hypothetical protein WP2S18C03_44300 [Aeromonas veronii]